MKKIISLLAVALCAFAAGAQQPSASNGNIPATRPPSASPQQPPASNAEFLQAADEVLGEMSQILGLPVKHSLKKSLRSKQEVRDFLIRAEKEDKNDQERYADQKSLEAFGLIPKDFPLDSFMLDVLTDQIAGLYDPKAKEFYIADWIPADEQKEVMAHELTHALEDQSFDIEKWLKADKKNDDASLARSAVSEGSALAAMMDYSLHGTSMSIRSLPDVTILIRAGAIENMDKDPLLSKAPMVIRDSLLFPYLAGTTFSQQFLKAHNGWTDLKLVFENPPVSTQQIMHPDLYLHDVKPASVTLPDWKKIVPGDWKVLDDNVMGEFGLQEILKQFIGEQRASMISPVWAGDHYTVFEDAKTKQNPIIFKLVLDSPADAARLFGQYSEALELKYTKRTDLFRRPNYFQFQADTGGIFLRCVDASCLVVEGVSRELYDKITTGVGWPAAPAPSDVSVPQGAVVRIEQRLEPSPAS